MYVKNFFSRLNLHLPFRVTLGKLGIQLSRLGYFLQTKYADWNKEYRSEVEFCPDINTLIISVSDQLIQYVVISFDSPKTQEDKKIPLVDSLFAIPGIKAVILKRYSITLKKATVYNWNEILPIAKNVIREYITSKK